MWYQLKETDEVYEAIEWLGDNKDEVLKFISSHIDNYEVSKYNIFSYKELNGYQTNLPQNYFIVKYKNLLRIFDEGYFYEYYEESNLDRKVHKE